MKGRTSRMNRPNHPLKALNPNFGGMTHNAWGLLAAASHLVAPPLVLPHGERDMTILDWITALASTATAIGVLIAVFQLWHAEKLASTEFEDQLRRDYRDICAALPVKTFMGQPLSEKELQEALGQFHQYFHLCNSQLFLRSQGRISLATWEMWSRGMIANFELDAFQQAWEFIHTEATQHRLEYLSRFLEHGREDPKLLGRIC